mmetsp:Transcript_15581/g.21327  ORF Transcript_15581/g.21327 Transcript_15581/m.21327 type:complete len:121 (-) Transcript_15581:243-605(-)
MKIQELVEGINLAVKVEAMMIEEIPKSTVELVMMVDLLDEIVDGIEIEMIVEIEIIEEEEIEMIREQTEINVRDKWTRSNSQGNLSCTVFMKERLPILWTSVVLWNFKLDMASAKKDLYM